MILEEVNTNSYVNDIDSVIGNLTRDIIMRISIDLTKEKFDGTNTVHFYDGKTFFFDPTTLLPSIGSFKV
jgi:hypothetical protein